MPLSDFALSYIAEAVQRGISDALGIPARYLNNISTSAAALEDSQVFFDHNLWSSTTGTGVSGPPVHQELALEVIGSFESECYDFARVPNWDGKGAVALTDDVIKLADRLAAEYASAEDLVEVKPWPDGSIVLIWEDESKQNLVRLAVGPAEKVHLSYKVLGHKEKHFGGGVYSPNLSAELLTAFRFMHTACYITASTHWTVPDARWSNHISVMGGGGGGSAGGNGGAGNVSGLGGAASTSYPTTLTIGRGDFGVTATRGRGDLHRYENDLDFDMNGNIRVVHRHANVRR